MSTPTKFERAFARMEKAFRIMENAFKVRRLRVTTTAERETIRWNAQEEHLEVFYDDRYYWWRELLVDRPWDALPILAHGEDLLELAAEQDELRAKQLEQGVADAEIWLVSLQNPQ